MEYKYFRQNSRNLSNRWLVTKVQTEKTKYMLYKDW